MHKSRLAGFIIDCRTDDLDQAALFWSQALGYSLKQSSAGEDAQYKLLDTPSDDMHIEVQKVEHPSRVHLDIEADDLEAEVTVSVRERFCDLLHWSTMPCGEVHIVRRVGYQAVGLDRVPASQR